MAVTQGVHRNTASEIDVLAALLVPQAAAFTTYRNNLLRRVVRRHVVVEVLTAWGVAHGTVPPVE